jgi:hypothetical protein
MAVESPLRLKMSRTQQTTHPEAFEKGISPIPEDSWDDALERSILSSKIFELTTCPGLNCWADKSSSGSSPVFGTYPNPKSPYKVQTDIILELVMQWGSSKHTSSKWLMSLSHNMCSKETVGFFKSTEEGYSSLILQRLKDCVSQSGNPFFCQHSF